MDGPAPRHRVRVALVAPSLRILGGQSVQADRLLRQWRDDPDVDAWLVPHNPMPPRPFRWAVRVKYARTLATETTYVPLLAREIARADVVHVFSASYSSFLLAPLPAIVIARALGRPIVLHYHSGEGPDHLRRSAIARTALARTTLNVVPSPFLADAFRAFNLQATVVPNLVDRSNFPFRERFPLRPRVLSTRNFESLYNVACTLRAFQAVQARWPQASLTLVGAGREEGALRALAAELGLRGITFAGAVSPDEIPRFYDEHDLYVQSPDLDNMPVSILEAYASGLPVVSTAAGGVPTLLAHGEHGLLAPCGDHSALAANILRLLDNPADARRMAKSAFEVCQACTWPAIRGLWLDIYRNSLAAARTSARASSGARDSHSYVA